MALLQQIRIYYHALMFAWSIRKFYGSISAMVNHSMAMAEAMSQDVTIPAELSKVKKKIKPTGKEPAGG